MNEKPVWRNVKSPILLRGGETTGFRDPTVIYMDGIFRLFYTYNRIEPDGSVYMYTAVSRSENLADWTEPRILTPRSQALNYSSPGNIVRFRDRWVMCLQTYPRPNGEKYGNADSRLWIMESDDLENWDEPRLLKVKGPEVPVEEMGRMIDPYLLEDKDEPGKWWCFYKQNGVSMSYSRDLENWTYAGRSDSGENVCVVVKDRRYYMFHSPQNGIGLLTSDDLKEWSPYGERITLDQRNWSWARGRLTAGFVWDGTQDEAIGKYLLFFHATGPEDEKTIFDNHACIGLAWSRDLNHWEWPGGPSDKLY